MLIVSLAEGIAQGVAPLAGSVDRNSLETSAEVLTRRRSPRGERG